MSQVFLPPAGASEPGSEASDLASVAEPDADALRRDLLMGHLLALATEDGLPRHALPALASSLQVPQNSWATLLTCLASASVTSKR